LLAGEPEHLVRVDDLDVVPALAADPKPALSLGSDGDRDAVCLQDRRGRRGLCHGDGLRLAGYRSLAGGRTAATRRARRATQSFVFRGPSAPAVPAQIEF